jgi:hypothetical protein
MLMIPPTLVELVREGAYGLLVVVADDVARFSPRARPARAEHPLPVRSRLGSGHLARLEHPRRGHRTNTRVACRAFVLGGLIHKYYAAATKIGTRCGESRFSTPTRRPPRTSSAWAVARSRDRRRDRNLQIGADSSGSMRNAADQHGDQDLAPESQKPRFPGAWLKRGTQESNLALRFWRPPCYRYTSPPRGLAF